MLEVVHFLGGIILVGLGAIMYIIMDYIAWTREEYTLGKGFWAVLGIGLATWGFILLNFSVLKTFTAVLVTFSLCIFISGLLQEVNESWRIPKTDRIVIYFLAVAMIATLIFLHWYFTTTNPGMEEEVDEAIFGTSTKTVERNGLQ